MCNGAVVIQEGQQNEMRAQSLKLEKKKITKEF